MTSATGVSPAGRCNSCRHSASSVDKRRDSSSGLVEVDVEQRNADAQVADDLGLLIVGVGVGVIAVVAVVRPGMARRRCRHRSCTGSCARAAWRLRRPLPGRWGFDRRHDASESAPDSRADTSVSRSVSSSATARRARPGLDLGDGKRRRPGQAGGRLQGVPASGPRSSTASTDSTTSGAGAHDDGTGAGLGGFDAGRCGHAPRSNASQIEARTPAQPGPLGWAAGRLALPEASGAWSRPRAPRRPIAGRRADGAPSSRDQSRGRTHRSPGKAPRQRRVQPGWRLARKALRQIREFDQALGQLWPLHRAGHRRGRRQVEW